MGEQVLVPVEIPLLGDERHKNWAKVVESVDADKSTGWAFEGPFVATGGIQDVPAGSLLLVYGERGSRANPQITARLFTVNADSTMSLEAEVKGKAWARTIRDHVQRALDQAPTAPDLSQLSDETLAIELESRGWRLERP